MKKKRGKIAVLALLVAVVLAFAAGCVSKTAETVSVGGQDIVTLYTVAGERAITGSSKSTGTDGSQTEITYGNGDVSIEDVNGYIAKLVGEDGYLVTQEAQTDGTAQTYQIGKQVSGQDQVILIDFRFDGGSTTITYTVRQGTVTPE